MGFWHFLIFKKNALSAPSIHHCCQWSSGYALRWKGICQIHWYGRDASWKNIEQSQTSGSECVPWTLPTLLSCYSQRGTRLPLPFPCVPGAAVTLTRGSIACPSIMALTFLRTVLSEATLRARLTADCALHSKTRGKLVGPPVGEGSKKGKKERKKEGKAGYGSRAAQRLDKGDFGTPKLCLSPQRY